MRRIKRRLASAAGVVLGGLCSEARADDWTGLYFGVGGGYGMANHELDVRNGPLAPPPPAFNVNLDGLGGDGGLFTLGVGADFAINRRFLVGAFFDHDWMDVNTEINASLSGFGDSARARAGFEVERQKPDATFDNV